MDPYLDSSGPELFELTGFGSDLSGSKPVHRPLVLIFSFNIYASFLAVRMWPFPFFVYFLHTSSTFSKCDWWLMANIVVPQRPKNDIFSDDSQLCINIKVLPKNCFDWAIIKRDTIVPLILKLSRINFSLY